MIGLYDTDIRLNGEWKLTQATDGDAPLIQKEECLLQDIRLEAICQEGELFYDEAWGWSLLDFLHSQDDELIRLEIQQRVRTKLCKRDVIDAESIEIDVSFNDDTFNINVQFCFVNSSKINTLPIDISRINVEVIEDD